MDQLHSGIKVAPKAHSVRRMPLYVSIKYALRAKSILIAIISTCTAVRMGNANLARLTSIAHKMIRGA